MKAILVIDIPDDYLEDYENFTVDYDLRGDCKDDNVNESIRYVEDCPLKLLPEMHGKIGDIDRLYEVFKKNVVGADTFKELFDIAPAIIDADKGEKE